MPNPCWVETRFETQPIVHYRRRTACVVSSPLSRGVKKEKKWSTDTKIELFLWLSATLFEFLLRRKVIQNERKEKRHWVSSCCDKIWSCSVIRKTWESTKGKWIMVSSRNGDHRNGHVLVENQQTRLEADSEASEATSKSKVYRTHFFHFSSFWIYERQFVTRSLRKWVMRAHAMSRVDVNAKFFFKIHGRVASDFNDPSIAD